MVIDYNNSGLIISAKNNNMDGVKQKLMMGADINYICPYKSITALYAAIENFDLDMCEFLCKNGANVNVSCYNETTPLGYLLSLTNVAYHGLDVVRLRIIMLLLRSGANPDIKEGGLVSSRSLLKIIGYTIENGNLIARLPCDMGLDKIPYFDDDDEMNNYR